MFFGRRMGGASRKPASWLVAVVLACFVLSLAPAASLQPAWAEPLPPSPILVSTPADLDDVRNDLGGSYVLTNDIDMSGFGNWTPLGLDPILGDGAEPFSGQLEGNGYAIRNLTVNDPGSDYQGLFGYVAGDATIRNLGLENVSVTGNYRVGGLAGENHGDIEHCYTQGNVTGEMYAGGLVGSNWGRITRSWSEVSVLGGSEYGFGGLVGDHNHSGIIDDCYSRGSVHSEGGTLGGLLGYNSGIVSQAYSTGRVTQDEGAAGLAGGLVGMQSVGGVSHDCFWDMESSEITESQGGTGLETEAMKSAATYTGAEWDLDHIWDIDGTTNDGYPFLRPMESSPPAPVEPRISVYLSDGGGVRGYGWPASTGYNLSVERDSEVGFFSTTGTTDPEGGFHEHFRDVDYTPEAGDIVRVTAAGVETVQHTVLELSAHRVIAGNNEVAGTTEYEAWVEVTVFTGASWEDLPRRHVQALALSGPIAFWQVDFTGDYDLQPGDDGQAARYDDDGNSTVVYWFAPDPMIEAYPDENRLQGRGFWPGIELSVGIDAMPPYEEWVFTDEHGFFEIDDVPLEPFYTVYVNHPDSGSDRFLYVMPLVVDAIDRAGGTVSGTSLADGAGDPHGDGLPMCVEVQLLRPVGYGPPMLTSHRTVTTDSQGDWSVDFGRPIDSDEDIYVFQEDEDGDRTAFIDRGVAVGPTFNVNPERSTVWGHDWGISSTITVTIQDGLHVQTTTADEHGSFYMDLEFQVGEEHRIKVTDGTSEKEHTVVSMAIEDVDPGTDWVWGSANPETVLMVRIPGEEPQRWAVTDAGTGIWEADFSEPVGPDPWQAAFDIQPRTVIEAVAMDEDGDATVVTWEGVPPNITVSLSHGGELSGHGWPEDTLYTVSIERWDDTENHFVELFTDGGTTDEEGTFSLDFRSDPYEPRPGDEVTVTAGFDTAFHTVQYIEIIDVDADANEVSGRADPGAGVEVTVFVGEDWHAMPRIEVDATETEGEWIADLGLAVPSHDLQAGDYGQASRYDAAGNSTLVYWHVPDTYFEVFLEEDQVQGFDWAMDETITVKVNDEVHPETTDADFYGYFRLDGVPVAAGDTVEVTDGTQTKSHTVADLAVTRLERGTGLLEGTAGSLETVSIQLIAPREGYGPPDVREEMSVTADETGAWTADFGVAIPEDWTVYVYWQDEDGDRTSLVRSETGGAYLIVNHQSNSIWGHAAGPDVSVAIGPPGDPLYTGATTTVPGGYYDFMNIAYDIQPGDLITLTDTQGTITHTVQDLWIDVVDLGTDRVEGSANGNTTVEVRVNRNGPDPLAIRTVTATPAGYWMADFSVAGPGEDPYSLQLGDGVDAMVWIDGNATLARQEVLRPSITVILSHGGELSGNGWPENTGFTVSIERWDEAEDRFEEVFTDGGTTDQDGSFSLGFYSDPPDPSYEPRPDDRVTVTAGAETAVHTIQYIEIDDVDADANEVSGRADPGTGVEVTVFVGDDWHAMPRIEVDATETEGEWTANLGLAVPSHDLQAGDYGQAARYDAAGHSTVVYWRAFDTYFAVFPEDNRIQGFDWTPGAPVTVTVEGVEYQTGSDPMGHFRLDEVDVTAGQPVTVDDGEVTKTHTVTPLAIDSVERATGLVTGSTNPGGIVEVQLLAPRVGDGRPETVDFRIVTASEAGAWVADFDDAFAEDLTVYVFQEDEDGDRTALVRPGTVDEGGAYLIVNHQSNSIWGHASGPVSVAIGPVADPSYTGQTDTVPGGYYEFMNIAYDIQPGDLITLTDSQDTTVTHVVQDLWIDVVDADQDKVFGRADPHTYVEVEMNDGGPEPLAWRTVQATEAGVWMADFSEAGPNDGEVPYSLEPGDGVDAMVWIDGNATLAHWEPAHEGEPHFIVDPYSNNIWGYEWGSDSQVLVVVEDGQEAEMFRAPFPTDEWGHFNTRDILDRTGVDLGVGYTVRVSQPPVEKTHTIPYVFVHMVDAAGVVKGWAAPGTELFVEVYETGDVTPGRFVVADGTNSAPAGAKEWIADFSQAGGGDCPCEAIVYAPFIQPTEAMRGTEGAVRVTDADGDATQVYWQAGGALAGIVEDGAGDPIEGARVWGKRMSTDDDRYWWDFDQKATTDPYGNYVIMGLLTGDYLVEARARGMAPQVYDGVLWYEDAERVHVVSPALSGGVDFTLEPGGSISGQVVDHEGVPVPWAQVFAGMDADGRYWQDVGDAFTDPDGNYTLAGLPDGDIMVTVYADGHIRKMHPDTYVHENAEGIRIEGAGDVTGVDFVMDPVVVRPDPETTIGDGIAWLLGVMNADGSWGSVFPATKTAFSLLVLGYDAFEEGFTSLDTEYTHGGAARAALEALLDEARFAGGTDKVFFGEPDNGDRDYRIYQTSIALMAIASTADPSYTVGDFLDDGPWTLGEIADAVVAYLEWSQHFDGGWSYGPYPETGMRSDQSNAGWATLALAYAEAPEYGFAIPVSGIVRDRVDSWIDIIQVDETMVDAGDANLGGARYTTDGGDLQANSLRTGNLLQQMAFVGDTETTPRVEAALGYLWDHWEHEFGYGGHSGQGWPSHYQAMYTVTKGLEAIGVELLGPVGLEIDWFAEFTSDIMEEQLWSGQWANAPFDRLEGSILSTQWALMTLQKATAPTLERADLAFQSVEVDPLGDPWVADYEIRFTVINRGNVETPVDIDVRLYVDDAAEPADTFFLPVMLPGMVSGEFTYTGTLTGTHDDLRLVIDEDETIEELRRDNNVLEFSWPFSITGQVRDADTGAPIAGAIVEALDGADTAVTEGVTDHSGHYALVGLPDGTYAVQASHPPQYGMQRIDDVVVVRPNETGDVNFDLVGVGNAQFVVSLDPDRIWGHHWPVGVELDIRVGPVAAPLFETTVFVDQDGDFEVWLEGLPDYGGELVPGALVTVTDGIITKQHTVSALAVTGVDPDTDTVSGTVESGALVSVLLYPGMAEEERIDVQADGTGQWTAQFPAGSMGPDAHGFVFWVDGDGDQTFVHWTAADFAPTFYTVPDSVDVRPGERFTVDVYLRDAYGIAGADFILEFYPAVLQVTQNAHLGLFEVIGQNVVDNTAGEIRFAGSNAGAQDFPDTRIYVIEFEAQADAEGDYELFFTNHELTDGQAVLVPAQAQGTAVRIFEGAAVTGVVNRPGMADNSGVLVTVEGEEITALTQADGTFTLTGLPLGTVRLVFTKDTYLVTIVTLEITEYTDYALDEMVSMRPGDINNDGIVNISDLTLLAGAYRAAVGDANYNPNADLNNDGVVNISDLTLLAGSYRQSSDE